MVNFWNGKRRRENEVKTVELEERFISKKDVALMLSCSTKTVERYADDGTLQRYRIGNLLRFRESEVLAALERKEK
jgi:excisionase family DNA binding protein